MRYIRIDLQYDEINNPRGFSFAVMDNIKRIIQEDMPYIQVLFSRDSPQRENLDNPVLPK